MSTFETDELIALAIHDVGQNRLDEGLAKLKAVVALPQGTPAIAFAEIARLYAKLGLLIRAQQMYERFLQMEPDALNERFQLGMACFDAGNGAQASMHWAQVLERVPTHPPASFFTALHLAQQGNLQDAHARCVKIVGEIPEDNLYHGRAKELLGKIEADPSYKTTSGTVGAVARKDH